jgi:hypothetical protein
MMTDYMTRDARAVAIRAYEHANRLGHPEPAERRP